MSGMTLQDVADLGAMVCNVGLAGVTVEEELRCTECDGLLEPVEGLPEQQDLNLAGAHAQAYTATAAPWTIVGMCATRQAEL